MDFLSFFPFCLVPQGGEGEENGEDGGEVYQMAENLKNVGIFYSPELGV